MKRIIFLLLFAAAAFAQDAKPHNEVMLGVDYRELSFDDWTEYHAAVRFNKVIARIARAELANLEDTQFEVEAYPLLGEKRYAYLSAGVSAESTLYPDWRAGAELYQGFGKGFEASLGYRRLQFDDPVDLYTASLGKYIGHWLVLGRVYEADQTSWQAMARRYFGDEGSYVGFRYGVSRDEIRSGADIEVFDDPEAVIEAYRVFPSRLTLRGRAGITGIGEQEGLTGAVIVGWRY